MNSVSKIQRIPIYVASVVTIVVMPSLMDPINLPKMMFLTLGAGLIVGVFWENLITLREKSWRPLLIISAWFAIALMLASIFSTQSVFKSVFGVWGRNNGSLTYISLLIVFLAIASQKSFFPAIYTIKALSILGIGSATYGLLQTFGLDPVKWENLGNELILTLGNSNFAGAFMALTAIASLCHLTLFAKSNLVRAILLLSYFVQMCLILKSEALQGLIISLLGSGLFLGFLLQFSKAKFAKRLGIAWWILLVVTSILALFSVFGIGPLASIISPYLGSLKDRYYHWVAAINMMKDHLFFGVGIDSFGDYYRLNRIQTAIDARGTAATGTNNAHNVILQIGATGGLMLLSAYLILIIFILYRGVRALKIQENKKLIGALISIWTAFQIQSLVSIDQIGLAIWGWVLGGCIVSISYFKSSENSGQKTAERRPETNFKSKFHITRVHIYLMLFGSIPSMLVIPVLVNEYALRNSLIQLVNSPSAQVAASEAKEVVEIVKNSKQPELRLNAANYLVQLRYYEEALSITKLNNKEFPNSFESWDATAQIYEGLGEKKRAIYPRQRSIDLDPLNLEIRKLLDSDKAAN